MKWRLNQVWQRMLCSCIHMATVSIKVIDPALVRCTWGARSETKPRLSRTTVLQGRKHRNTETRSNSGSLSYQKYMEPILFRKHFIKSVSAEPEIAVKTGNAVGVSIVLWQQQLMNVLLAKMFRSFKDIDYLDAFLRWEALNSIRQNSTACFGRDG